MCFFFEKHSNFEVRDIVAFALGCDACKGRCDEIGPAKCSKTLSSYEENGLDVLFQLKTYVSDKMGWGNQIAKACIDDFVFEPANETHDGDSNRNEHVCA